MDDIELDYPEIFFMTLKKNATSIMSSFEGESSKIVIVSLVESEFISFYLYFFFFFGF